MMADPGATRNEQQHPQYRGDRQIVTNLLAADATDYNLAELARLRVRYDGFPGARDIQADIEKAMQRWGLTTETLFEKTRAIHDQAQVYRGVGAKREDWS
jgi:hypothetical protein